MHQKWRHSVGRSSQIAYLEQHSAAVAKLSSTSPISCLWNPFLKLRCTHKVLISSSSQSSTASWFWLSSAGGLQSEGTSCFQSLQKKKILNGTSSNVWMKFHWSQCAGMHASYHSSATFSSNVARFVTWSVCFMDVYHKGLNRNQAAWASHRYCGYRVIWDTILLELENADIL